MTGFGRRRLACSSDGIEALRAQGAIPVSRARRALKDLKAKKRVKLPHYDVRGGVDLGGDVDATDKFIANNYLTGTTAGRGVVSGVTDSRRGYAGYTIDGAGLWHVRHRVLDLALARWLRRDPLGYVDGVSMFEYAASRAVALVDPYGTTAKDHCVDFTATPDARNSMTRPWLFR